MGLDMYLKAKLYTSKYFNEDVHSKIKSLNLSAPGMDGACNASVELSFEAGYWRKANQIHNWFVKNVQDGVDECQPHCVSLEQLTELRDLCKQAIETRNAELLPPSSGFFFGDTEVNERYWEQLQHTADGLTKLLEHPNINKFDFTYQSSW